MNCSGRSPPPAGGFVKYLTNNSLPSIKISFEDLRLHFFSAVGIVQAKVELFAS